MRRTALFILTLLLLTPACKGRGGSEGEIRGSLNLVARTVDPAYDFAVDACLARQNLIVDAVEHKQIGTLEGDRQIAAVRVRCDRARATFDLIRRSHDEARRLIDDGQLEAAQRKLDEIIEAWRSLKGGTQ